MRSRTVKVNEGLLSLICIWSYVCLYDVYPVKYMMLEKKDFSFLSYIHIYLSHTISDTHTSYIHIT